MKILKYNLCTIVNHGTEEEPKIEEILSPVTMGWNEVNEEIAKKEAYNGEYEIIDDGQPEPEPIPSGGDSAVWDELDEAYQKGVDSV
jgi:hypothetical protein